MSHGINEPLGWVKYASPPCRCHERGFQYACIMDACTRTMHVHVHIRVEMMELHVPRLG
jgi:hypothetical protein